MRRKRLTATIACLNTIFTGFIAGIYAGEVPRIQYQLADQSHWVIFGNLVLFAGMAITTLIFWPLPLLHGRRPYTLVAFGLLLPLQIPQALAVASYRSPDTLFRIALLLPRALTGLALGFANINLLPTLMDLFGASLMSERPHQEAVTYDDVRRQGGGIGIWLGIWCFCFSSSLSIGFCVGACIISKLDPSWGFWLVIILLAFFLLLNVLAPETRKSAYRRSVHHFYDDNDPEKIKSRVARGEVKLHISDCGPKWWWEEVWAGLVLTKRMVLQPGFFVLMTYLAWINAQLTLVILLLGALLSRNYRWPSYSIGLAVLSVPIGALFAMPLTKASWLSRARVTPPRTDSMTMRSPRFTWSSHFTRRLIFSLLLPLAGLGYCLSAPGPPLHWSACVIFAGLAGFLTDLGTAECVGLIMETFDTCDLQPGVNTKHRLQSMSDNAKRRRTNYSSFPRVCAGFFASQSLGFLLAAAATVVSGRVTDAYGSQTAISITAAVLLGVTVLFFCIITRFHEVQVVPQYTTGTWKIGQGSPDASSGGEPDWKPVVIGHASGKMRRVNLLEMGKWTRWSEIRRLNKLIRPED
ncbi:MFS transporter [Lecanosticta acicola]|uniref:MFS transporter n=1 Tax=Lecanosticta acicola TaxID=111012 RepID=A0AAI8Z3L6_9PEZI|nr:MFS transporter [Lecanosticta acicola]